MPPLANSVRSGGDDLTDNILIAFGCVASIGFLAVLVMCACWGRKKRPDPGQVVEKEKESPADQTNDQEKQTVEEKSIPPPPEVIVPPEPEAPAQMTVIAAEKKGGKGPELTKPKSSKPPPPPNAARYDDPAYRTIGRDFDDPFAASHSVAPGQSGSSDRKKSSPKKTGAVKDSTKPPPSTKGKSPGHKSISVKT